jgi:ferredoxin-type protein NapG
MSIREYFRDIFRNNPFKGYFKINRLRPPGAVEEKRFMELCIRCARCIEVCPYDSIKRADLLERLQIGTPYIFADERACYLCMKCPSICPTGALDNKLFEPEKVKMGVAVIDQSKCLNYLYVKEEEGLINTGKAQICSTCYNVCPLQDKAILMEKYILPVITDKCTGCGICVEKCPTEVKSVNITPEGMGNKDAAGFYYQRSKMTFKKSEDVSQEYLKGDSLLKKKQEIQAIDKPKFKNNFTPQDKIEGW